MKLRFLFFHIVLIFGLFVYSYVLAADWPRFHGDNQTQGRSEETLTVPFQEKWTFQASNTINFSSPVATSSTLFVGDDGGKFYAINTSDGTVAWTFNASSSIVTTAAIDGTTVYFGDNSGNFYARSTTDGSGVWTFSTTTVPVSVSPVVNATDVFFGLEDGKVVALNKTTGATTWTQKPGGTFGFSAVTLNGAETRIFVTDNDGKIHKIRTDNGNVACTFTATNDFFDRSSPVWAASSTFAGSDGGTLYSMATADCTLQDTFTIGSDVIGTIAYDSASDKIYIGSLAGDLYKLSYDTVAETFSQDWKINVGAAIESSPVITTGGTDRLFLGADAMYVFDPADGNLLWSSPTDNRIGYSSVAIHNGEFFIIDISGKIYAYEETQVQGAFNSALEYNTGSQIITGVTSEGNNIYFGTTDNKLYSLTTQGVLNWTYDAASNITTIEPAVDTTLGAVYFGTADKAFHAVNISDGSQLWKRAGIGLVTSQVTVKADTNEVYVGTNEGKFYSLNAMTSAINLSYDTGFPGLNISSSEIKGGSLVLFTYGNKALVALNRSDFSKAWEFTMGGSNVSENPVFVGKNANSTVFFVGGTDGVYAIDDTGDQVWKRPISGVITGTMFDSSSNRVYASTQDGRVIGINATSSVAVWSTTISSSPVSVADTYQDAITLQSKKIIYVISGEDGIVRSSFSENVPTLSPVRIKSSGDLFLGNGGGKVKKFDTDTYSMAVTASLGGTMTTIFGDKLEVAANALAADTTITLSISENDQTPPAGTVALSRKYQLGPDGTTFSPSADFKIAYNDSVLQGKAEADIRLFVWDSSISSWEDRGGGTLDTTNKLFLATLDHFSEFVAFAGIPKELTIPIFANEYQYESYITVSYSAGDPSVTSVSADLNGVSVASGERVRLTRGGTNTIIFTATKSDGTTISQSQSFQVIGAPSPPRSVSPIPFNPAIPSEPIQELLSEEEISTTTESITITPIAGGLVALNVAESISASVLFPADAVSTSTRVAITSIEKLDVFDTYPNPARLGIVGDLVYDFVATAEDQAVSIFTQPIKLTFSYTDEQVSVFDESALKIYYWDGTYNQWVALADSTVDSAANIVTATTTHFTPFAVMGPPIPSARKIGDISNDGKVDILDFNILMVHWGETGPNHIADINRDKLVGVFDFNLLMVHWAG